MRIKTRSGKPKDSGLGNASNGQSTFRLRAIIRHLPPLLKESEFRDVMANYINDETTDDFTWNQGKVPEECVASRK